MIRGEQKDKTILDRDAGVRAVVGMSGRGTALANRSPDGDAPSQTTAAFPQPGEVVNGFKHWKNVIFPRLTLLLYSTMERGDYEGWMSVGSHIVTDFYLTPLLRRV